MGGTCREAERDGEWALMFGEFQYLGSPLLFKHVLCNSDILVFGRKVSGKVEALRFCTPGWKVCKGEGARGTARSPWLPILDIIFAWLDRLFFIFSFEDVRSFWNQDCCSIPEIEMHQWWRSRRRRRPRRVNSSPPKVKFSSPAKSGHSRSSGELTKPKFFVLIAHCECSRS